MKPSYLLDIIQNNRNKYIQDSSGSVYKILPEHFLQMSPSEGDRRVYELDNENYHILTFENACMIVNKQYQETDEKWEHKGRKLLASAIPESKSIDEHTAMLKMLPSHKNVKSLVKSLNDDTISNLSIYNRETNSELKMVRHKGKVYYILIINEFLPRVKAYNMFGEFCQWCNIKHCKPIFDITNQKYI